MSTTLTATTTQHVRLDTILNDYEVRYSAPRNEPDETETHQPASVVPSESTYPDGWDTSHRRVPSYRPINRTRDLSEVRVYVNQAERAFVTVMFTGLFVNAVSR